MKIPLNGQEYEIRKLGLNELGEFEDRFGSFQDFDPKRMTIKQARCLIWLSLKRGGCKLTEEEIGDLVDPAKVSEYVSGVFGIEEKEAAKPPLA